MENEELYTSLKHEFNILNDILISEGIDEIVSRCFDQVKENIHYLNKYVNEESTDSLNNNSKYIDRSFKIKETQQLFKYCILLLEKEDDIKPQYKLVLENLLDHFQCIFSSEKCVNYPYKFSVNNRSNIFSKNLLLLSTDSKGSFQKSSDLEEQLLHEKNKGK